MGEAIRIPTAGNLRAELARLHSQAARPRARIALLTTIVERAA